MSDSESNSKNDLHEAYATLGLEIGASFDEVQFARDKKLEEIENDPLLRAKVESCYDLLLMESLKARQLGNISNDAVTASQKEKKKNEFGGIAGNSLLTKLRIFNQNKSDVDIKKETSTLNMYTGNSLAIRVALGVLVIVLLLISPNESIEIILSLSTIAVFISKVREGKGLFQSLGWSVVFLSIGLIIGGFLASSASLISEHTSYLSPEKLEAIPALILLWLGALLTNN